MDFKIRRSQRYEVALENCIRKRTRKGKNCEKTCSSEGCKMKKYAHMWISVGLGRTVRLLKSHLEGCSWMPERSVDAFEFMLG